MEFPLKVKHSNWISNWDTGRGDAECLVVPVVAGGGCLWMGAGGDEVSVPVSWHREGLVSSDLLFDE